MKVVFSKAVSQLMFPLRYENYSPGKRALLHHRRATQRAELKGISAGFPVGYVPDVNVIVLSSTLHSEAENLAQK